MKLLFSFALTLFSIGVHAQDYKTYGDFQYCKDTVIYQGVKLRPGDSIHLGFGSGASKDFLFVWQQMVDMKKRAPGIDHPFVQMAGVYMILKRIEVVNKRQAGIDLNYVVPIFGYKREPEKVEWFVQFTNAINSKEISFVK